MNTLGKRWGKAALAWILPVGLLVFAGSFARADEPVYQVKTDTAQAVEYAHTIRAFGIVQPDSRHVSTLVSMVGGIAQRVDIRPGQPITKGDTPVTILTDPAVRSQVVQVRAAIRLAEETLARVQPLYDKGLLPKAQVDNAQRDLAAANAQMQQLQAEGALDAEVKPVAPADGIVTSVLVKIGDQVSAGAALLQASDPDALLVRIGVEAADAQSLSIGTPVTFTALTGLEPGDPLAPEAKSTVTAIEYMIDPQTRLVPVSAAIAGDEALRFLIGQTVSAEFQLGKVASIRIPRAALVYEGKTPIVFVAADDKAQRRETTLIAAARDWVYVSDGVKDGETVITQGQTGLRDGASLKIVK